ncbi:MAG: twin-arginine translocase TatA/TatE family subunit [Actinobacteria bacterium]|nr:twin-arginine translocase TatA/TatE family subunit [Actinomycetota bacterium]
MPFAVFGFGPVELLIILVVIIVFFLPTKLPVIARKIGEALKSVRGLSDEGEGKESK